ncbi:Mov34/MPN/PAD-1 family protein [Flagellimonas oceanensis]|uniref:Mov34/MPN/PAD-1 family protein n=1 Tax=Flagellimonas oceanensis TaxID=2499163 RepID=UPI0013DF5BC5|nr:Mov34/MPN/PAD-1 family protein [Allomuricauda oceanensis]
MKLHNKHRNVELIINQELLEKISQLGIDHYPNEFGGFLIGKYSDDYNTLFITDYILPKSYKGSRSLFERSAKGTKSLFSKLFKIKKEIYVGEWHTHPNGSTRYSDIDLRAMINIESSPSVNIKNPVLLILSVSEKKLNQATFYIYENKKLIPYE